MFLRPVVFWEHSIPSVSAKAISFAFQLGFTSLLIRVTEDLPTLVAAFLGERAVGLGVVRSVDAVDSLDTGLDATSGGDVSKSLSVLYEFRVWLKLYPFPVEKVSDVLSPVPFHPTVLSGIWDIRSIAASLYSSGSLCVKIEDVRHLM